MKTNQKNKLFTGVILFIILFVTMMFVCQPVKATVTIGGKTHLYGDKELAGLIQLKKNNALKLIVKVYYLDPTTNKRLPAFCVEPDKDGVGTGASDYNGYDALISENLEAKYWRALSAGYVGKNWQETTVENDDDWYMVTKATVHCLANNTPPSSVYKVVDHVAKSDGITLEEGIRRSTKILNECEKLYHYSINDKNGNYEAPTVNLIPNGGVTNNVGYLTQKYTLSSNKTLKSYDISLSDFPTGTTYTKNNATIEVKIPKANITNNITGTIHVNKAQVKSCPAFLAKSYNKDWQNYAIAGEACEMVSTSATLNINTNTAGLQITKIDKETKQTINNVTFQIAKDGTTVATITTNSKGIAELKNIRPGKYTVKEIKTGDGYILSNKEEEVQLKYGETTSVTLTNEYQKGNIKVVKVDARDNTTPVQGAKFEVYAKSQNTKVAEGTTDANGTVTFQNLRIGVYQVKEVATNQWYYLDNTEKTVVVEYNKTATVTIANQIKTASIEVTKKDMDYHHIKLKGVVFEIMDATTNQVVDIITTNAEGKATSKELPINKTYLVKEQSTISNYHSNKEVQKVTFSPQNEGKSISLQFYNKHQEGKLSILKVDSDNEKYQLGHIGFVIKTSESHFQDTYLIWNKSKQCYDHTSNINDATIFYTNSNGAVTVDHLRVGDYYTLIESETNQWYNSSKDISFSIQYNKENKITVKNKQKKGSVKIIKVDTENQKIKLEGVKFDVYADKNNNGKLERDEYLETITTDKNGFAQTKEYGIRDYEKLYLKEVKTDQYHLLDEEPFAVELVENTVVNVTFGNAPKKGKVKIVKVDSYDKSKKISGVKFRLYEDCNENGIIDVDDQLLEEFITNENGVATSGEYRINKKYLYVETETPEAYLLDSSVKELTLEENKVMTLVIENTPKTIQLEVIKVDEKDSEIKIPDVEFEIYEDIDQNGVITEKDKLIDTITTDREGRATSQNLRVTKKYIIRESKHNVNYQEEEITQALDFTEYLTNNQKTIVKTLEIKNTPIPKLPRTGIVNDQLLRGNLICFSIAEAVILMIIMKKGRRN